MSKDMENQSLSDSHNLTGNSGLLGMSGNRPKLQPIRVKTLLAMYPSDEEDSEDRGKESDSESECEDIQLLPDDDEAASRPAELPTSTTGESIEKTDDPARGKEQTIDDRHSEKRSEPKRESSPKRETSAVIERTYGRNSLQFTDNFDSEEQDNPKLENHKSASLPSESASVGYSTGCSVAKSSIEINRRSTTTFRAPDSNYCANNKSSYTLISSKSESSSFASHLPIKSKSELSESNFFPNERRSHGTNHAHQSEPTPTSVPAVVPGPAAGHLQQDTPIKNIPPIGSMRPTPSLSHRSMFQTPQSSKLQHQDYSKNRVQTPGTIFENWSQRHMAQTPLQSRSNNSSGDSVRVQTPSIIASRRTVPAVATASSHESSWYRGTEERKVRRPLGESMQSSVNHQQHLQSEKPMVHYTADSSTGHSNHHEPSDKPLVLGVLESIKERSSNKSSQPQQPQQQQQPHHQHVPHESKENRHPSPLIEKLSTKEEEPSARGNFEAVRDSIGPSSKQNIPHENRPEAARHRIEPCDPPSAQSVRTNSSATPKNVAPAPMIEKNNVVPQAKANIQLSIPSSIRRSKQGETITVKGKEYLILGTLGEGMSGHVLRVQDLSGLELRAIKVVNLSRMDKDCAQGCLQEISMLHKLQAPCVVRMFDYEIEYPMVHVVMEMGDTDFRSLLHSMSEKKRLPLTMILYYWTEMLTAVKHIHDNGVIHSDLKPANFLLVRGRLKLIDFGIASSMNADMTSVVKSSPIGTLNYISPEAVMDIGGGANGGDSPNQNVKYKITFKSDVWSLGCILYSLVYGYTPFNNIRAQWAKIQAITNPNPKISFALPAGNDVEPPPPILIDVMRKCLQHDPKARPTVTQLLQIPYIPTKPISRTTVPDIPSNIVMKIRHSLTDDEWRQFTEIMEARRNEN